LLLRQANAIELPLTEFGQHVVPFAHWLVSALQSGGALALLDDEHPTQEASAASARTAPAKGRGRERMTIS
jgi:hypothetical protein